MCTQIYITHSKGGSDNWAFYSPLIWTMYSRAFLSQGPLGCRFSSLYESGNRW